jgi:hypothetical protein
MYHLELTPKYYELTFVSAQFRGPPGISADDQFMHEIPGRGQVVQLVMHNWVEYSQYSLYLVQTNLIEMRFTVETPWVNVTPRASCDPVGRHPRLTHTTSGLEPLSILIYTRPHLNIYTGFEFSSGTFTGHYGFTWAPHRERFLVRINLTLGHDKRTFFFAFRKLHCIYNTF